MAAAVTGDAGPLGVSRRLIPILLPVAFGVGAVCGGSCHAAAVVEGARGGTMATQTSRARCGGPPPHARHHERAARREHPAADAVLPPGAGPLPGGRGGPRRAATSTSTSATSSANFLGHRHDADAGGAVYAPHAVALRWHVPVPVASSCSWGPRAAGPGEEGRGPDLGPRVAPGGADDATALMRVAVAPSAGGVNGAGVLVAREDSDEDTGVQLRRHGIPLVGRVRSWINMAMAPTFGDAPAHSEQGRGGLRGVGIREGPRGAWSSAVAARPR